MKKRLEKFVFHVHNYLTSHESIDMLLKALHLLKALRQIPTIIFIEIVTS